MTHNAYQIEPLGPAEIPQWDALIAPYANRTLFHRQVWLDYLEASQGIAVRLWRVADRDRTLGYFCGGLLNKGPFKILGSPLRGWGTNFLGPTGDPSLASSAFLASLDALARRERLSLVELESLALNPVDLTAARYEPATTATFVVEITAGKKDLMWGHLDSTRRTGIRKAERGGLIVEEAQDGAIADEFYDQYLEVMHRKGLQPPYSRRRPQLLFQHLHGAGLLMALRVRTSTGDVVATGLFPHDDVTMYFWGGASSSEGYKVLANEYMHWTAMCLAADRGLRSYNMCGNGLFKKKFGGELVEVHRWSKCYSHTARVGRSVYQFMFNQRLRLQATLQKTLARSRG